MTDIVIELMFEELPAKEQRRLQGYCEKNWLADSNGQKKILVGPRRVAMLGLGIAPTDLQKTELKKGPRTNAPKEVIGKFLTANGLTEKDLKIDGDYYFYQKTSDVKDWLVATLSDKNLFSKTMVWQAAMENGAKGQAGQWRAIRPLRQIIIQVDDKPMTGDVAWAGKTMGLSQQFIGHRFLGGAPFTLNHAKNYEAEMDGRYVKFSQSGRAIGGADSEMIFPCVEEKNLKILDQAFLYDEVLPLVEYPFPMLGKIDDEFMGLPQEIIISTIKNHQKFIPLYDKITIQFSPYFLIIANNGDDKQKEKGDDKQKEKGGDEQKEKEILAGYQRVLRARLADAKYFLQEDSKHGLHYFRDKLKNRLFFQGLGTLYDKTERVKTIALKYKKYFGVDNDDEIKMASELCKADLTTHVVNEMPELQGIMGGHYAKQMDLADNIATAIAEQYQPVPNEGLPALLAFADRLDTLIEFFKIGKMPTGSSDPFALRRAAFSIINILNNHKVNINFMNVDISNPLKEFLQERFLYHLDVNAGISPFIVSIIKKQSNNKPTWQLVELAINMQDTASQGGFFATIIPLTKRAINIVNKDYTAIDEKILLEDAEQHFFAALQKLDGDLKTSLQADDMLSALRHIAAIEPQLNDFFDKVMVNDKDEAKKQNRHALLNRFLSLTGQVADFSLE